MTLSLIDRLPAGRRTEVLRKLSANASKRATFSIASKAKPLAGDGQFAPACRAWTGRLAFLGIEIVQVYPVVGPSTVAVIFPKADLPVTVIVDPNSQGAVPADFNATEDGVPHLVDYTGASGTAPWDIGAADIGVTTKGSARVTA
jgi:hypothetical protein